MLGEEKTFQLDVLQLSMKSLKPIHIIGHSYVCYLRTVYIKTLLETDIIKNDQEVLYICQIRFQLYEKN